LDNLAKYKLTVANIQGQRPWTGWEDFIEYVPTFTYHVLKTDSQLTFTKSNLPLCGQVLLPHTISYVLHYEGYLQDFHKGCTICPKQKPKYYTLPLQSDGFSRYDVNNMAVCNPFQDTSCKVCVEDNVGYEAWASVFRDHLPILYTQCLLMVKIDCGVKSCTNGQYATDYAKKDSNGYVTTSVRCLPCQPGTWLTCQNDANCAYEVPEAPGDFTTEQIYKPNGLEPIGACYPCDTAGGNKVHYGLTNNAVTIRAGSSSPLKWYCPGGSLPPVMCEPPYAGSDTNNTYCVCPSGKYNVQGTKKCEVCPAGFSCDNGWLSECLDGYYQDKPGAATCNLCQFDLTGGGNACEVSGRKMVKCTGSYKSRKPQCVQCNACRRPYETDSAGLVDCY